MATVLSFLEVASLICNYLFSCITNIFVISLSGIYLPLAEANGN
jgi:hypothetical protein